MIETLPTIGIAMPTAADWGQLYQFNGTGDAGLIMPPRSYYFRDFFTGGWTDMAIGMIHCETGIGAGQPLANLTTERQTETNVANLFHFGLSKSGGSATINVASNPTFVGARSILGGVTQINTSPLNLSQLQMALVNGASPGSTNGSPFSMDLSQGVSGSPFSMVGLRFTFNPATGILAVNYASQTGVALADEPSNTTTLTTFLEGLSNTVAGSKAQFNLPSVADFSTYYIYWPFLNNQLKLHCVGAIKLG